VAGYREDELSEGDRRTLKNAADKVAEEREVSEIARQHGYTPGKMSRENWSDLADDLTTQAKEELKYASESDRQAAGDKLRGKPDEWMQVGGQDMRVRSGASRKEAQTVVKRINEENKEKADSYMTDKLVDYGYDRDTIEPLDYTRKRRLIAEIGHGVKHPARIKGINNEEREQVIDVSSERQQREAQSIALNPRAAKGLETWGYAMQAAERADRWSLETPPDYIYDEARAKAPKYVLYPKGDPNYIKPEDDFIDF
jgi:hypothetical protein